MKTWEEIYNTGITEIDKQHQMFVGTLNKLYEAIELSKEKEEMEEIFEGLVNYGKYHFATEEKYFDAFHYEGASEHKTKHEEFRKRIEGYQEKLNDDKMEFTNELVGFLEDWLANHIMDVDKKYVPCFKEHGLK